MIKKAKKTKEEIRAYFIEYRKNNLEKFRLSTRKWNKSHKEVCRLVCERFRERNPNYYTYGYNKAWRKRNVSKRTEDRARYYGKHRYNIDSCRRWLKDENDLLFSYSGTDVMLAKLIGRSVEAIQVRRCFIKTKRI